MLDKRKVSARVSLMATSAGFQRQRVMLTLNHRAPGLMASDHLRYVTLHLAMTNVCPGIDAVLML